MQTHLYLGHAYYVLGDYQRSTEALIWHIEHLKGDAVYQNFELPLLPAISCRIWLSRSLVHAGAVADGAAMVEEAVRIAETSKHLYSLTMAQLRVAMLVLGQGDVSKAIPVLERLVAFAQEAQFLNLVPQVSRDLA